MATLQQWTELIGLTAEACGTQISEAGLKMMAADLYQYDFNAVGVACAKCRRELKFRLTLSDIIERLQADDGRPSANEAWGMFPKNSESTALVTNEIMEAGAAAWELLQFGDKVAARMAFNAKYEGGVELNRAAGLNPRWQLSVGNSGECTSAATDGLKRDLLSLEYIRTVLKPDDADFVARAAGYQLALPAPTEKGKQYALEAKNLILGMIAKNEQNLPRNLSKLGVQHRRKSKRSDGEKFDTQGRGSVSRVAIADTRQAGHVYQRKRH